MTTYEITDLVDPAEWTLMGLAHLEQCIRYLVRAQLMGDEDAKDWAELAAFQASAHWALGEDATEVAE